MQNLQLDDLLIAARKVGLDLRELTDDEPDGNLYVWATPNGQVLYIGKAEDPKRTSREQSWVKEEYDPTAISIGFVVLMRRHQARCHRLQYAGLDTVIALTALTGWEGGAIDTLAAHLRSGAMWTVPEIELVLIRMAIAAGYPIGNAAGAGLWESQHGGLRNALAAVAVINDDTLRFEPLPHRLETDAPASA